jgi:hypothetical protein
LPRRTQAHPDARAARQRANDTGERDRAIHSAAALEARAKVDDFDRISALVDVPGDKHRRVAKIGLMRFDDTVEIDFPKAESLLASGRCVVEQRAERRVTVDPRRTAPDETACPIDERRNLAVPDRPKVERRRHVASSSHLRTAATSPSQ